MSFFSAFLPKQRRALGRVLLLLGAIALVPCIGRAVPADPFALRAAFVFNFLKFTEYDSPDTGDAFNVCVVSGSGEALAAFQTLAGKMVRDRPIKVLPVSSVSEAQACRAVYVPQLEPRTPDPKLEEAPSGLLTIGEGAEFTMAGGIIGFYQERDRLRFEINQAAAERKGLRFSSKLLILARVSRY